jgi:hypothetical protein
MSSRLALAMSASALFVALLGSTPLGHALSSALPRNSVGPLQLKRNAVGPQKVAPNAIRSGHILDGSLLAADFKAGQIPPGPKGDPGAPGLSEYQIVTGSNAVVNSTTNVRATSCPAGKKVVGGGIAPNSISATQGPFVYVSQPRGDATGWIGGTARLVPASWTITVWAVCAKVS